MLKELMLHWSTCELQDYMFIRSNTLSLGMAKKISSEVLDLLDRLEKLEEIINNG